VRDRAEARSDRFLQIALRLLTEGGPDNLSVRKVVELSGMSLRSFYQSFAGRDDLFLAIYEEATLGGLERQLEAVAFAGDDPLDRLRAFLQAEWVVVTPEPSDQLMRSLVGYHQRLRETRPTELAMLLEPQHTALTVLLAACGDARPGPDLDNSALASILMHLLVELLQARVLGFRLSHESVEFEQFWTFVRASLNER
jgi:AcrR family transcriptional regulator